MQGSRKAELTGFSLAVGCPRKSGDGQGLGLVRVRMVGNKCAHVVISISRHKILEIPLPSSILGYVLLTERAGTFTHGQNSDILQYSFIVCIHNQTNIDMPNSTGIYYNLRTRSAVGGKVVGILQATLKKKEKKMRYDTRTPISMGKLNAKR